MVAEFRPSATLLPQNVDAEEALLGAILLDPEAIGRVIDKLKPEAFYITAHSQIYKAALAIHGQGGAVDLMTVTTWLYDHRLLEKVGGQSRLADMVERTISSINVDRYADLIIDKYIRRQLIATGNEIIRFGYESFRKLPEIFTEAKEKLGSLMNSPLLTGEDPDQLAYNKLILEIQQIELGCVDPGVREWKLQELAKQYGRSTKQLEALYFKSLLKDENESLLTWKELCDRYGDEIREWLLHGFLPKGVTTVLHAKGGVGKTRLAYDMIYSLLTGASWNGFPTTGKRRVAIIQTDESAGDMMDALKRRGFDETQENVRYKTRWTFEHLPQLLKDCEEFQPEVIVMDSITSMSRHSLFSENDVHYARPILKLKDLAQRLGCTIVIIHHSSKIGDARGTSAIFNSVSEVWKLERDTDDRSPDSTKRLLTIEKSRSRRPTTYKLDFQPEEGSWTLLEEVGVDEHNPDLPIRERIIDFLLKNPGIRYEAAEIAHEIQGDLGRVRLLCTRLAGDGMVSVIRKNIKGGRGSASKYFIDWHTAETDRLTDRPPESEKTDRGGRSVFSVDAERVSEKVIGRSVFLHPETGDESQKKTDRAISLRPNADGCQENKLIALTDRLTDRPPSDQFIPSQNVTQECDSFSGSEATATEDNGWTKKLFGVIKRSTPQPDEAIQRRYPDKFEEIQLTPAPFKKGDRVWFDDPEDLAPGNYTIESCGHTQARLEGRDEAVNVAWLVLAEAESFDEIEPAKPNNELTDEDIEDMAESGFDYVPYQSERPRPYHTRTNPPKKGDRIRSGSGKAGQITLTRTTNPRYEITWEDGRKMGYDFQDLETLDIRREN